MLWEDILKIVAALIASVGGAGAIIWALSSFFGKMWANKILEKQKAEYQKDIEEYKNALSCELETVKATNEKLTYISKIQYDIEIEAIRDLTQASHRALLMCFSLIPYDKDLLKNKQEMAARNDGHYKNFTECINSFMDVYGSSLAFIEEDIAQLFLKFLSICRAQFDFYNQVYRPQSGIPSKAIEPLYARDGEIEDAHKEAINAIREHLKKIQVAE